MNISVVFVAVIGSLLKSRSDLVLENVALRQQLALMKRSMNRPRVRGRDRVFWVLLLRFWIGWRDALVVVKPETVVRWHRKGFKLFWRWKSPRRGPGRSPISPETKALILRMARANPLWGAPRIHGELLKLGIQISERTVSSLIPKRPKPPSQTWHTFLKNHMAGMASTDFFTVPTATFKILYVFIVLSHGRRRIVHFNVTSHPTAVWTARQISEAFPWDAAPRYLLRDNDSIYGEILKAQLKEMGIREIRTAYRSPWQSPYVERVIGSIRRDCLNHMIVLNKKHLRKIVSSYLEYYHHDRTHLGLEKDSPIPRPTRPSPLSETRIVEIPRINGLHHRYEWNEAA